MNNRKFALKFIVQQVRFLAYTCLLGIVIFVISTTLAPDPGGSDFSALSKLGVGEEIAFFLTPPIYVFFNVRYVLKNSQIGSRRKYIYLLFPGLLLLFFFIRSLPPTSFDQCMEDYLDNPKEQSLFQDRNLEQHVFSCTSVGSYHIWRYLIFNAFSRTSKHLRFLNSDYGQVPGNYRECIQLHKDLYELGDFNGYPSIFPADRNCVYALPPGWSNSDYLNKTRYCEYFNNNESCKIYYASKGLQPWEEFPSSRSECLKVGTTARFGSCSVTVGTNFEVRDLYEECFAKENPNSEKALGEYTCTTTFYKSVDNR